MIDYIIKDLMEAFEYLPFGLIGGAIVAAVLCAVNMVRRLRDKEPLQVGVTACLITYLVVMFCITFLSRELGSRSRRIDMELFSTWGTSPRNHAYVVENVLLFIPYGYLMTWNKKGKILISVVIGLLTSLLIESLQLVTGRGYFQIDDVFTNTLGMIIGSILFAMIGFRGRKKYAQNIDCRRYAK